MSVQWPCNRCGRPISPDMGHVCRPSADAEDAAESRFIAIVLLGMLAVFTTLHYMEVL